MKRSTERERQGLGQRFVGQSRLQPPAPGGQTGHPPRPTPPSADKGTSPSFFPALSAPSFAGQACSGVIVIGQVSSRHGSGRPGGVLISEGRGGLKVGDPGLQPQRRVRIDSWTGDAGGRLGEDMTWGVTQAFRANILPEFLPCLPWGPGGRRPQIWALEVFAL